MHVYAITNWQDEPVWEQGSTETETEREEGQYRRNLHSPEKRLLFSCYDLTSKARTSPGLSPT